MSEMAKAARAAMKKKAEKMTTADPHQKVDSSTWTPPDALNADVKTGMRPVSRRAFKKGGKVEGDCAPMRADRKPRKAGGRSEAVAIANAKVNRNVKDANEERDGIKHVGGMKKGGRAKKFLGGPMMQPGGMMAGAAPAGGVGASGVAGDPTVDPRENMVGKSRFNFGPGTNANPNLKRGGKAVKFEGSAKDEKQDKKLAKKHGMSMKSWEHSKLDKKHDEQQSMKGLKKGGRTGKSVGGMSAAAGKDDGDSYNPRYLGSAQSDAPFKDTSAGASMRDDAEAVGRRLKGRPSGAPGDKAPMARKAGGKVFSGEGYPHKVPGVVPGGRTAHASGGKTGKGKTNVNIIIAAGQPAQGQGMGPPPGGMPPRPPGGQPVAVPPPNFAAGAPAPAVMPVAMPMAPPQPAGGPPPMGRKSGGRTFKSYKDMKAGSGSGEGRLEKTEIQEHKRMMRKDGGHVYPKMKYGAGSGEGRLQKIDEYGLTGPGKAR